MHDSFFPRRFLASSHPTAPTRGCNLPEFARLARWFLFLLSRLATLVLHLFCENRGGHKFSFVSRRHLSPSGQFPLVFKDDCFAIPQTPPRATPSLFFPWALTVAPPDPLKELRLLLTPLTERPAPPQVPEDSQRIPSNSRQILPCASVLALMLRFLALP